VRRSADLVIRLGDGTEESHRRMQSALDDLWVYTGEMFIADGRDEVLASEGIVPDPESLREPWLKHVTDVLSEGRLKAPSGTWMQKGGKQGRHTEHLGYILAEMQFLQRSYPNAQW
jgi:ring-1,2-phenylacetyl-CoA epoxidase subunit PaaC